MAHKGRIITQLLGGLSGLHKEVSTKEAILHGKQAQLEFGEIQGQVWHPVVPTGDMAVSGEIW